MNSDSEKVRKEKSSLELAKKIREEIPNIVLPSRGMFEEEDKIDIKGKDYIIHDNAKED